jgi:hypothetical protein
MPVCAAVGYFTVKPMKYCALSFPVLVCALVVHAQGTVYFSNASTTGLVNAPVYESDGVTKCSGPQFMAELFAGPAANNLSSIATTGFFTGVDAGYFDGLGQQINSVAPRAVAWIQVDVWNTAAGATFAQAKTSGLPNSWWQSSVFTVITGGGFQGAPPVPLTGLGTSPVFLNSVPEPSALALVGLAAGATILRRLNKSLMTNRRCPTPLRPSEKIGRAVYTRASGSAAVAYLCRYA